MNGPSLHSIFLLTLFALSILTSCQGIMSHQPEGELSQVVQALEGKEPLLLSEANPYLAPNVLISLLKQESDTIRGFLSDRGTPDGVRVISGSKDEAKIELFYLSPDELYRLEEKEKIWVILGPEAIQREFILPLRHGVRKKLKSEKASSGVTEQFEQTASGLTGDATGEKSIASEPRIPSPTDSEIDSENAVLRAHVLELTRDSKGGAVERDERGDLLHQVISQDESFLLLSLWYTLSKENGAPIARINGKSPAARLQIGETVKIPSYLIKNSQALSVENIEKLMKILISEPVAMDG